MHDGSNPISGFWGITTTSYLPNVLQSMFIGSSSRFKTGNLELILPKRHQSNSLQSVQWTFPDLKKKHAAIGNIMASWTTIDTQFQSCSRSRFKSFEKSDWLSLSHIYKHSVHQWIYNSPTLLNTLGGEVKIPLFCNTCHDPSRSWSNFSCKMVTSAWQPGRPQISPVSDHSHEENLACCRLYPPEV